MNALKIELPQTTFMTKGNYLKTQIRQGEGFTKPGIRNQKTSAEAPPATFHLCSAPKYFNHSPSLATHPSSTWACTPPPQFWLHIQSITHRLETQLAKKRLYLAQLISSASPNPTFYWEVVSLNCSPDIYGNRLYKGGHDPTRKGRAKTKRLFRI